MSAIDEMYEKYGIKQKITCTHAECPQFSRVKRDKCPATNNHPNEECLKYAKFTTAKRVYPDFTAEKQLELIKLIIELDGYSLSIYKDEGKYVFELFDDSCTYSVVNSECDDYTDSLALLVSQLTEYLDNQEVKEILER